MHVSPSVLVNPRRTREHTENLDKEVYSLKVRELVVIGVDAYTEEETGIATVDDLVVSELSRPRPSMSR